MCAVNKNTACPRGASALADWCSTHMLGWQLLKVTWPEDPRRSCCAVRRIFWSGAMWWRSVDQTPHSLREHARGPAGREASPDPEEVLGKRGPDLVSSGRRPSSRLGMGVPCWQAAGPATPVAASALIGQAEPVLLGSILHQSSSVHVSVIASTWVASSPRWPVSPLLCGCWVPLHGGCSLTDTDVTQQSVHLPGHPSTCLHPGPLCPFSRPLTSQPGRSPLPRSLWILTLITSSYTR